MMTARMPHASNPTGAMAQPASARRVGMARCRLPIAVPRDRDGSFEAELVKKGQTRIDGMDDKIIGLCAAGLTV